MISLNDTIIRDIKRTNSNYFISGPCSFESYEELYGICLKLKHMGVKFIRAGVFKPRTSPYSFQGIGEQGINIIKRIKDELNIKFVVELTTIEQINKFSEIIDIIQIGSRNMYNYELLKMVGKTDKHVLLKRGLSATIQEWLMAAEYIAKEGNTNIILCERGIRSFDPETRNVLDLQSVPVVKKLCNLPIIVDPSHASGRSDIVEAMSRAAIACGADGLIIESHTNPKLSKSDADQTISMSVLKRIKLFYDRFKKNN